MKTAFMAGILNVAFAFFLVQTGHADQMGGQVFYRYGWNSLSKTRSTQVFTDTNGASGKNDGTSGWNIGAGLDLPLAKEFGPGDLLGEIMVGYAHFSDSRVRQTTSALLSGTNQSNVTVSELTVLVAPKYRLSNFLDGKLRPWIIPAGLAFLVNSPPSNDSNYLDIGYQAALGLEYVFVPALSLGADFRYTVAANEPNLNMTNSQYNLYLGINF